MFLRRRLSLFSGHENTEQEIEQTNGEDYKSTFESLPGELIHIVLSSIPIKDLQQAIQVNTNFQRIIQQMLIENEISRINSKIPYSITLFIANNLTIIEDSSAYFRFFYMRMGQSAFTDAMVNKAGPFGAMVGGAVVCCVIGTIGGSFINPCLIAFGYPSINWGLYGMIGGASIGLASTGLKKLSLFCASKATQYHELEEKLTQPIMNFKLNNR